MLIRTLSLALVVSIFGTAAGAKTAPVMPETKITMVEREISFTKEFLASPMGHGDALPVVTVARGRCVTVVAPGIINEVRVGDGHENAWDASPLGVHATTVVPLPMSKSTTLAVSTREGEVFVMELRIAGPEAKRADGKIILVGPGSGKAVEGGCCASKAVATEGADVMLTGAYGASCHPRGGVSVIGCQRFEDGNAKATLEYDQHLTLVEPEGDLEAPRGSMLLGKVTAASGDKVAFDRLLLPNGEIKHIKPIILDCPRHAAGE